MQDAGLGVWEAHTDVPPGGDYSYELTPEQGRARRLPDPCSREQPRGLRGPSRVFDAIEHDWGDRGFRPRPLREAVLYELHVGTFTEAGTFDAAIRRARAARKARHHRDRADAGRGGAREARLGLRRRLHLRGAPRLRRPRARCSGSSTPRTQHGIAVILDVVYNHLGASGVRAIESFGPYFTERYQTFWGKAINYDDEYCDPVREWVLQSAAGWVRDFHVDGLRLDAIHAIFDQSPKHIVAEIAERVTRRAAGARS